MYKKDIAAFLHSNYEGTTKVKSEAVTDAIFEAITKELASGEKVSISDFGTFSTKKRAAREARNPKTGEKVKVKASIGVKFKAAPALKEALN